MIARAIIREVQCSVALGEGHVNIIRPHELLLTTSHLVLVTQYSDGGSLADYFAKHARSEDTIAFLFNQFSSALSYCHKKGIAYRDVKMENTLVDMTSDPPILRLCDFGVARKVDKDKAGRPEFNRMHTFAGTPGSLSPQMMEMGIKQSAKSSQHRASVQTNSGRGSAVFNPNGAPGKRPSSSGVPGRNSSNSVGKSLADTTDYNGAKADVWSSGVLLCILFLKENPFAVDDFLYRADPLDALDRILQKVEANSHWSDLLRPTAKKAYEGLSADLKSLLDRMLDIDEERRASMDEVRTHPWLRREFPGPMRQKLEELRKAQAILDSDSGRPKYSERDGDALIEEMVEFIFTEEYEKMARARPTVVKALPLGWALLPQQVADGLVMDSPKKGPAVPLAPPPAVADEKEGGAPASGDEAADPPPTRL